MVMGKFLAMGKGHRNIERWPNISFRFSQNDLCFLISTDFIRSIVVVSAKEIVTSETKEFGISKKFLNGTYLRYSLTEILYFNTRRAGRSQWFIRCRCWGTETSHYYVLSHALCRSQAQWSSRWRHKGIIWSCRIPRVWTNYSCFGLYSSRPKVSGDPSLLFTCHTDFSGGLWVASYYDTDLTCSRTKFQVEDTPHKESYTSWHHKPHSTPSQDYPLPLWFYLGYSDKFPLWMVSNAQILISSDALVKFLGHCIYTLNGSRSWRLRIIVRSGI